MNKKEKKYFRNYALFSAVNGIGEKAITERLIEMNCPEDVAKEIINEIFSNRKSIIWYYAKRHIILGSILFLVGLYVLLINKENNEGAIGVAYLILLVGVSYFSVGILRIIKGKLPYEKTN